MKQSHKYYFIFRVEHSLWFSKLRLWSCAWETKLQQMEKAFDMRHVTAAGGDHDMSL